MRQFILSVYFILHLLAGYKLHAQSQDQSYLFRISDDNDFLNYRGKGTDEAYTNGLRIDLFYEKMQASRFFIDRLLPTAGAESIDIFQTGLMQVMYTPVDICTPDFQPGDYNYSGGLFASHSLLSYNPEKKYDVQTELDAGIRGPAALSGECQTFVHRAINYQKPMGWTHQLRNYPLLNLSFAAEKQVGSLNSFLELIVGGKISAGSQMNALSFYPLIRIGKMNPYFEGYIRQFSSPVKRNAGARNKAQFYFTLKPEIKYVLSNAMLDGEVSSGSSYVEKGKYTSHTTDRDIKHVVYSVDFGAVVAIGFFGISFTQNISSMLITNTYGHEYGNFTFYFRL